MRIAVVGGGVAGICSVHHITKDLPDAEVVGFEVNEDVGGTWIYTDKTGVDEFGIPLSTSMYKSLRTNLPKQVMELSDYTIPRDRKTFMENEEYLDYLRSYAEYFDVKRHYKFRHYVTLIKFQGNRWSVKFKNLLSNEENEEHFDYVFVCNGHYSEQSIPDYEGRDLFKGRQMHSHNYRIPDSFTNKRVLLIGSGPSGLDISLEIAKVAKAMFLSHHNPKPIESPFPPNYFQRPDVKGFTENSVIFMDGTTEEIDEVLYCTGYAYHCPFLDASCGIVIERTHMTPLYRQVVNIEHPSMFFIGVPQLCCVIPLSDMQVRYVVAALKGSFKLPSKKEMMTQMKNDFDRKNKTIYVNPLVAYHTLGKQEPLYFAELSEESGIKPVPAVFSALRFSTMETKKNLYTYRNHNYHIIDDEHFIRTYKQGTEEEWKTIRSIDKCLLQPNKKSVNFENSKSNDTAEPSNGHVQNSCP